jgi:hypothetical protein
MNLIFSCSSCITVAGPTLRKVVITGSTLVTKISLKSGQTVATSGGQVALIGGRTLGMTLAVSAASIGMIVPRTFRTFFAGLALCQGRTDATTGVRIAYVARFFARETFWKNVSVFKIVNNN